MTKRKSKVVRQEELISKIKEEPFVTDEELSEYFEVSIQTIRLDRLELRIPELRARIKNVAQKNQAKVKSLGQKEIIGELIELRPNESAISIMDTNKDLSFEKTKVVRGYHIFSMAESLAMAIIDSKVALTGVANMKYIEPVLAGERLVARAEVVKIRGNKYFVHVKINVKDRQVFRGKFILVSIG